MEYLYEGSLLLSIVLGINLAYGALDSYAEVAVNRKLKGWDRLKLGPKYLVFWVDIVESIYMITALYIFGLSGMYLYIWFSMLIVGIPTRLVSYTWMVRVHRNRCTNIFDCVLCGASAERKTLLLKQIKPEVRLFD